jgi:hypothetical protein
MVRNLDPKIGKLFRRLGYGTSFCTNQAIVPSRADAMSAEDFMRALENLS